MSVCSLIPPRSVSVPPPRGRVHDVPADRSVSRAGHDGHSEPETTTVRNRPRSLSGVDGVQDASPVAADLDGGCRPGDIDAVPVAPVESG
jgi:hypothetical protein